MTADEFRARIHTVWGGHGAQGKAARHWDVDRKTVQRWQSGAIQVPGAVASELREMTAIARPAEGTTPDQDRDEACAAAIAPVLGGMSNLAIAMGWSPAEVHVAVLSLAASELLALAGDVAAIRVLREAEAAIRATPCSG